MSSSPVLGEVYSIQTLCDKVCLTCGSSVKMRGDCSFFFYIGEHVGDEYKPPLFIVEMFPLISLHRSPNLPSAKEKYVQSKPV